MSGKKAWLKHAPLIFGVIVVLVLVVLLVMFFSSMEQQPEPKKTVQQITVITPPPPPPTPPEPEPEQEPEPEEPEFEDEPEPEAEALSEDNLDDPVGDADGAEGGSGDGPLIGGRSGNRKGVRGGKYAGLMKREIYEYLNEITEIKRLEYNVSAKIWVDKYGVFERFSIDIRSGDYKAKELIEKYLWEMERLSSPPGPAAVMPVTIRLKTNF